jgi:acyl-CoA synthetase (AMP-forming)/AMP-acid ligase II
VPKQIEDVTGAPETVPDLLAAAAQRFGDAPALEDDGGGWTFTELLAAATTAAAALADAGVQPDDRVGIWAPNASEWVIAALGVACAGAVLVPINTRAKGREAAELLARAGCGLLLTTRGFLGHDYPGMLAASGVPLPDLRLVVLLRGETAADPATGIPEQSWAALVEAGAGRRLRHPSSADQVSHVQFTSGTTGEPKGVMLRHRALCGTTRDWVANVGLHASDRYLIVSPMFHVSGHKTGMLACLTAGATMLPYPVFEAGAVLECVERERITVLPGPPTIYQSLLAHPDISHRDLSSLRLAVTGAASIPPVLVQRMHDELGFATVVTAYGTTETTGVVTMTRPGDDVDTTAHTSGRAIPGVEVAIVDEAGTPVAAETHGEIIVRGYNVMAGYLDDETATRAAIDANGWFHTGDVGWLGDDGNLRITDRLGDIFIVGGFNAYPAEIEAGMLRHPDVVQVAVIGVSDERLGEVGWAFVVARPGAFVDRGLAAETLLAWCREEMANYKAPRRIVFVDSLPLNASGKVRKLELRELAAQLS